MEGNRVVVSNEHVGAREPASAPVVTETVNDLLEPAPEAAPAPAITREPETEHHVPARSPYPSSRQR